MEQIIKNADTDGSGFIDYTEFLTATMNIQSLLSKEKLEMAFSMFDTDKSGTISVEELKQVLGRQGKGNDPLIEQLIKEADVSGDGEIDLKEFKDVMLKLF